MPAVVLLSTSDLPVTAPTVVQPIEQQTQEPVVATEAIVEVAPVVQVNQVNEPQSEEIQSSALSPVAPVTTAAVEDDTAPARFDVDPIPDAVPVEKKVSALSLSSIRARKEMESSIEKKVVNPDDLPKEPFTSGQFMEEWGKYADKLARSGFMLMSSLMGMVPPVINGASVSLEMPNEGSKLSFDENKFDLVNYLRKKLSNYDLEIEITVNEEVKIQKRVLDKEDKLVRFIELNPAMQHMKEIFDLEFKY